MAINIQNGNTLLTSGSFPPARVASIGSPLNPATGGLLVVDGIQLVAGDRVLCKDETSAINNGIYAASTGPWVRTSDAAGNQNFFAGMAITVALGTTNAGKTFLCTSTDDPVVIGTSNITFAAQNVIITASITINPGLINQLAYYASAGSALSGLATANNGVLITSGAGAPSISSTLPTAVQGNITHTGTVASGTWQGTVIGATYGGTGVNNGSNTLTLSGNLTIATNGGTIAFGAASKTLTVDNSLEFAGTDSTKFTFPSTTDTVVTLTATQTLTNKTLTSPTISGGTIDNAVIGGTTPAAGTFTKATITPTQAANTSVDGLILLDSTAATSGNQQFSPRLRLTGQGWKTTVTAASQAVDWIIENQPVQGSSAPTSNLVVSSQINGGGYTALLQMSSGGVLTVGASGSIGGQLTLEGSTSGSATISVSSTGTPQYPGTTTNDSAPSGDIGEYQTASASGVSISSGSAANITSKSLTAGDWEITGNISIVCNAGCALTQLVGVASLTTASLTPIETGNLTNLNGTLGTAQNQTLPLPATRASFSTTTTVFLNIFATFGGGTATGGGFLRARRVR